MTSCNVNTSKLPALIPREVIFGNPEKMSPEISPDGKRLAYIAPDKGVLNVWVRTIGKADDKVVTKDRDRGIRSYFWAEDNKHIIYEQDKNGDENWHIYSVDLETDEIIDLTPFEGVKAGIVATDHNFPNEMLISMNKRDEELFDVYHVDLTTNEIKLAAENPGDIISWGTDNNFKLRVAHATLPDGGAQLRIRDTEEDEFKEFISWGPLDNGGSLGFAPDNKALFLADNRGVNTIRLYEIDLSTKNKKEIIFDKEVDLGPVIRHPTEHYLQAVGFVKDKLQWKALDSQVKEDFDLFKEADYGEFSVVSRDLKDENWIIAFSSDVAPVKYYSYNRADKKLNFLFSARPDLEKYRLVKVEPVKIKSRDGLILNSYLALPPGKESKNLPLVLYVHGGPWVRDSWGYDPVAQWLANRGYAVLQVNYRGSSGFGKDFLNAGNKEWGRKMQDDLTDSVKWAVDEQIAGPEKIAIYGGSYGGYATLAGVTFTPDLYCCAAELVGPSNLITFLKTIPPYWEPFRAEMNIRVGDLDKDEEMLKERSPLFSVDKIKAPLLIAQGAYDPRVKKEESEQIVAALNEKNIPVKYLLFGDEGHGFAKPENRLKFFAEVEKFFAEHLGGRFEP